MLGTAAPVVGVGGTVDIVSPSSPNGFAIVLIGFDPGFSPILNVPLPFDLAPLGFPGCNLYASGDAATATVGLDASGNATYSFAIPDRAKWCGQELSFQALVLSPSLMASNGLYAEIGS